MLTTQPLTAAGPPAAREPGEAAIAATAPTPCTRTAFDLALTNQALSSARERYALQRGAYGTPPYRSAWLLFGQKIRTLEELNAALARSRSRRSGDPTTALARPEIDDRGHQLAGNRSRRPPPPDAYYPLAYLDTARVLQGPGSNPS